MRETPNAKRPDPAIARRALDEAKKRRAEIDAKTSDAPREVDGRGGLDPARYGDWEIKGISSDF
ncbi:DUF1674 domain-containing protein [Pelagibacterium halotolerans]|uniref:DUF1674 domain-containing protein n=1 Tax=Pelagibacterium halotolerans (strain DSM 22347 / JCM 15775 / CGMCC 1.7692 / B2) TaxID=1082931 RepID=G4R6F2_PELHB|nr:DUF1674 domain-containing protein [Pelagibacterium halotolerans]AEQ53216.1 hypothetical protein KKY_3227 [Pelagibacterium halotolerans B2]QJR17150.1 DUF1674 domain-containing protein [Pelagibacterium halotolerans]SEA96097.1 Protein of unknown function [Pelagibacterium halotolerans]